MTANPRQSFRFKLILWTVLVSTFFFLIILGASVFYSGKMIRMGMESTVNARLDCVMSELDGGANTTAVVSRNLLAALESPGALKDDNAICELIKYSLDHNPGINGIAIGFEPGVVKGHDNGYSPYYMRSEDGYIFLDLSLTKDYRSSDWYGTPFKADSVTWSKPFFESNGMLITSLNSPIHNAKGDIIGIAAVDISLSKLSEILGGMRPFPEAEIFVLDANGTYVANTADGSLIGTQYESPVKDQVMSGEKNYAHYLPEGKKRQNDELFLFFAPAHNTGWTVVLTIPRSVMAHDVLVMMNVLISDSIIGVILLIIVCFVIISRLTKPLEQFADAAKEISHGNFDAPLPIIKDHNELYDLRQALAAMGVSIHEYVAKLSETSKREAQIENELNIARGIQMSMVPKIFPPYPERDNVDIFASLTPAQAVGGDLYDFILCGDKFFFCIGDVSGKGVPASLFMAITRSLFRNTANEERTPADIAKILNQSICEGNEQMLFVTMFIGCCDLKTGQFSACNCGHNAPVTNGIIVDPAIPLIGPVNKARFMSEPPVNIPIGVVPGYDYKEARMRILPGTKLLIYTDGITEAENSKQELFGNDRLISSVSSTSEIASAEEVINKIMDDVHDFTNGAPQSDDITCLAMIYKDTSKID